MSNFPVYYARCNIPVLVMGETGCGKTRLIRYLCDMVAKSKSNGQDTVKNMLIMKVIRSHWYIYILCVFHCHMH